MPRPTIIDLKLTANRRYWPSLARRGRKGERFETLEFSEAEDAGRVKSSHKASQLKAHAVHRKTARKLSKKLSYKAKGKKPPSSMASNRHMRRLRNRIFSQIDRLVRSYRGKVTTFTVVKRGWEFSPDELLDVDLDKLLNGFLSDLNRRGAAQAEGWLIAFIHGEHKTPQNVFPLHVHGIVAGGMIGVVDKLRKGRNYKSRKRQYSRDRSCPLIPTCHFGPTPPPSVQSKPGGIA